MLNRDQFEQRLAAEPMFGPTRAFYAIKARKPYSREYFRRLGVENTAAPCLVHMSVEYQTEGAH